MHKNELINLLETIEGNPEIMFWNGFVCDVIPIDKRITKGTLYREKADLLDQVLTQSGCSAERIKERVKSRKWEYHPSSELVEHCEKKNVYILQPKIAGKKYFDRTGSVEY